MLADLAPSYSISLALPRQLLVWVTAQPPLRTDAPPRIA